MGIICFCCPCFGNRDTEESPTLIDTLAKCCCLDNKVDDADKIRAAKLKAMDSFSDATESFHYLENITEDRRKESKKESIQVWQGQNMLAYIFDEHGAEKQAEKAERQKFGEEVNDSLEDILAF